MSGFEHYIRPLIKEPKPWHLCDVKDCEKLPSHKCGYLKLVCFGYAAPVRKEYCADHAKEFSKKHNLEILCN